MTSNTAKTILIPYKNVAHPCRSRGTRAVGYASQAA
jgi:hypothetical protein